MPPSLTTPEADVPLGSATGASGRLLAGIGLLIAVAAPYLLFLRTTAYDFVRWDDDLLLLDEDGWRGLSLEHLRWMLSSEHMGHWQPLTWLSYAIDHARAGLDPSAFHATNVAWHSVAVGAFFLLSRELLQLRARPSALRDTVCALAAALFFGLHPLRVESVAWVTERRDVVSGSFFILAVWAWVRAAGGGARLRAGWYAAAFVATALSLMAKAWGMVLPVVFLLLDAYPLRRLHRGAISRSIFEKLPFLALALGAAVLSIRAQGGVHYGMMGLGDHGFWARVAQAGHGVCFYPFKTLVPVALSPIYDLPSDLSLKTPRFLIAALAAAVVSVGTLAFARRRPAIPVVWWVFLATVTPVLGFAQSGPQLVADRYSYLSCLGFALLLAAGLRSSWDAGGLLRWGGSGLALAWILGLSVLTARQCPAWTDSVSLWRAALRADPDSWVAQFNRATEIARLGEEEATAAKETPDRVLARVHEARAREHFQESLPYYTRAIELRQQFGLAHSRRASILAYLEHFEEALEAWGVAVSYVDHPDKAHTERGRLALKMGRLELCVEECRAVPDDSANMILARMTEGAALRRLGRHPEAIDLYRRLLQQKPGLKQAKDALRSAQAGR